MSVYPDFSTPVRFQKTRDVPTPEYGTPLSAGFDLAPADDVALWPGDTGLYPTGLIIQAPVGHMLMIVPRSSTWRKWGVCLANTVGIVDEDFCGPEDELQLYLYRPAKMASPVKIPAGTRLAQGIFVPITRGVFVQQDEPIAKTRGGWGSTGD
jgi:dUTP pyrophosphatase